MRKRIIAVLLTSVMMLSCLTGCGQNKESAADQSSAGKSESSAAASTEGSQKDEPITTDPVTISILVTRHAEALSSSADDIWFFKYLEWWINQQGYNAKLEVEQTLDTDQQISLLLGTDSLPDIVWGINLTPTNAVTFGAGEKMILDWGPYITEETMPNLYALMQEEPDAQIASTCTDGGIYALPKFANRNEGAAAGNFPNVIRVYINQKWLDQCNLEVPTTMDDFLTMLRTFKSEIKLEDGQEVIPMVSYADLFERYFWTCLGYYGASPKPYGTRILIKDEKVVYPAATEDYRTFIEFMKTCYDEGLISPDYFTMESTTAQGLMASGVTGVIGEYSLTATQPETFKDWVCALPAPAGDNDQVVAALTNSYITNMIWASADTEYPEIVAKLVDYIYSAEGTMYYLYGPKQGEDPLGILDGWYFEDRGDGEMTMTCDLVKNGTYETFDYYCKSLVYPEINVGNHKEAGALAKKLAGLEITSGGTRQYADAVTGNMITINIMNRDPNSVDGWWRITSSNAWESSSTVVRLPDVYMVEEDALRAAELDLLLSDYVTAESVKFITGSRPISEIDDYFKELDSLGLKEYTELYEKAYSVFLEKTFQ